jgi:hypothetical protein
MKKIVFPLLFLVFCVFLSCQNEQKLSKTLSYEEMMGKGMECWKHVIAPIDRNNLSHFQNIYSSYETSSQPLDASLAIPKVIHFIWIGPKDFPRESIVNVQSWIDRHPGWTVKFWTDRKRNLPSENVLECVVTDWMMPDLAQCFEKSDNYAEKADLLRYDILLREGGVYVDHDVKCMKSFDNLCANYEFFCGLELPSDTPITSSIHVTNNLIGARAAHPVLRRCAEWLPIHWDEIERLYPGKDKISVIRRIANRTFSAFADSVRELACRNTKDMVFPAFYFNAPSDDTAIYARHLYAGTWFQNENPFEQMAKKRLMSLSKKVNKILLFTALSALLNMIGFIVFFIIIRKKIVEVRSKS